MLAYELKLKNAEDKMEKFGLRLTAGGQRHLMSLYENDDIMSLIMGAFQNINDIIAILETSLCYKGNTNSITDGEEFYDLLVDNGYCGAESFSTLILDVAVNSGIITKKQRNSVVNTIVSTFDSAFDNIEQIVKSEDEETEVTEVIGEKH